MKTVIWTHPKLGEVQETLCDWHANQLLGAVKVLGMGVGIIPTDTNRCGRCQSEAQEIDTRIYLGVWPRGNSR